MVNANKDKKNVMIKQTGISVEEVQVMIGNQMQKAARAVKKIVVVVHLNILI